MHKELKNYPYYKRKQEFFQAFWGVFAKETNRMGKLPFVDNLWTSPCFSTTRFRVRKHGLWAARGKIPERGGIPQKIPQCGKFLPVLPQSVVKKKKS